MKTVEEAVEFIQNFVEKGGPESGEREFFLEKIKLIADRFRDKSFTLKDQTLVHDAFGDALSLKTLQGFIFQKPYGYNGDFEVMERVYRRHVCEVENLSNWDELWQVQNGSNAVRYRVQYLRYLIKETLEKHGEKLSVLDVASGSGRDIFEFYERNPEAEVEIDCIDIDKNAIEFAQGLLHKYLDRLTFFKIFFANKNGIISFCHHFLPFSDKAKTLINRLQKHCL